MPPVGRVRMLSMSLANLRKVPEPPAKRLKLDDMGYTPGVRFNRCKLLI